MQVSRQQQIDEQMCRPGYRWNPTLGRCVGGAAVPPGTLGNNPQTPGKPTPDDAIQQEIANRQSTGEV